MKTLFDSTEIDHLKLKNRLFRSATWEGLAAEDGTLTEEIYSIYENLAKGGVGTIITGLTDISEYDQALPGNMRLYSDLQIESYRKLTELCHHYECNIIPQINLNDYVSSSRNGNFYRKDIDHLTEKDILHIIELFCGATERAIKAGFLPLAKVVSENVKVPLILVGRNRHLENMERILNTTPIAYFSMSRSLIREPDLPNRWESGDLKPAKCISCDRCFQMHAKRCVFNR